MGVISDLRDETAADDARNSPSTSESEQATEGDTLDPFLPTYRLELYDLDDETVHRGVTTVLAIGRLLQ